MATNLHFIPFCILWLFPALQAHHPFPCCFTLCTELLHDLDATLAGAATLKVEVSAKGLILHQLAMHMHAIMVLNFGLRGWGLSCGLMALVSGRKVQNRTEYSCLLGNSLSNNQ